jgi:hypothetical protein
VSNRLEPQGSSTHGIKLHLIEFAVRIVELKIQVKLHLPSTAPCQSILAFILGRMPRLIG